MSMPRGMQIRCGWTMTSPGAPAIASRLLPPTLVGWVPFSMREGDSASSSDATDLRRQLPLPDGYTNVRNAGSETEWLQPAYVGRTAFHPEPHRGYRRAPRTRGTGNLYHAKRNRF